MDMTQRDLSAVLEEFLGHRFETVEIYAGADRGFFRDIVTGVAERQAEIDPEITSHLAQGWRLSRIDSILRAILRSGVMRSSGAPMSRRGQLSMNMSRSRMTFSAAKNLPSSMACSTVSRARNGRVSSDGRRRRSRAKG